MADPTPGRPGAEHLADEFRQIWAAIRELKSPSGTQRFNAVPKLQEAIAELQEQQQALIAQQQQLTALVDNIQQTLADFIQNDIDSIVDAAVTARLASPFLTLGVAGGTVRMPSLYTTDVTLTNKPRATVWVDSDGLVGRT